MKTFTKKMRNAALITVLLLTGIINSGAQWVQTNGPLGGNVNCLVACGTNIFAGTDYGIYKSTNNGGYWAKVKNGTVNYIASNSSDIFAVINNTVYLSSDNGTNWSAVGGSQNITSLAVSGSNIFLGTMEEGILFSPDKGQSWSFVNNGLPLSGGVNKGITSIAVSGSYIYAGTDYNGGIFLSTDNGANWSNIGAGDIITIVANGADVYVGTWNGLYYSNNYGTTWSQFPGMQDFYWSIAVDSANIYVGSYPDKMYFSNDYGASWNIMNNGLPKVFCKSILISGSNIFAATYGCGVFLSSDNGANWVPVNEGFIHTFVRSLAVTNSNIFAGGNANGLFKSFNNGSN